MFFVVVVFLRVSYNSVVVDNNSVKMLNEKSMQKGQTNRSFKGGQGVRRRGVKGTEISRIEVEQDRSTEP